jgi:hypothetical protein
MNGRVGNMNLKAVAAAALIAVEQKNKKDLA